MVDPSPELEDLMRTMVLEGRVESSMQSPTLEEAIGPLGGSSGSNGNDGREKVE